MQKRQDEWEWQWQRFFSTTQWLFEDWIFPNTLEDFKNKYVLDAGCGPGHHARFIAPYAGRIVAMDLNTADVAKGYNADLGNVTFVDGDIATYTPDALFDTVYCIGVVHHTDDPDATVANLKRCVKPGGRLILWVYSKEGNSLNEYILEPLKKLIFLRLPKSVLYAISSVLTAIVSLFVYSVYLLPLKWLPYYEYFQNWRKLNFTRNNQNVFDKLNAPQTIFISKERAQSWLTGLIDAHLSPYRGVSWRISGTRPQKAQP